jgi:hypothetical protein
MPTTRPGFIWSGTEWVAIGQEAVVNPFYYQATAPTGAATGAIWVESDVDVPSIDSSQFLRWRKTMTGGETSLSGNDDSSLPLAYTPGYEQLYINGVLQVRGGDYTATTGTTVTGLTALVANDVVEIFSAVARTVADVYTQTQSDARFVNKNVGGLNLVVPTSVTGGTLNANGAITVGSAVTSVVVNGAFSAAYDNYEIIWSGGVMASSSGDSQITFRLDGSSTGYSSILRYSNGSTMSVASQSNATQWNWIGGGSTGSGLMQIKLYAPFLAVHTRMDSNGYNSWNNVNLGNSNGVHTVASSYTGFTVLVSGTGSMTGGTIRIYGYNNGA